MVTFAKTTRPVVARTVMRPRLFRWLDRQQTPVTWITGPPGAGKTTLIASYLVERRERSLWYQLDAGDGDLATLFYFLGQAARPRRHRLPLLTSEYRSQLTIFASRFFRELYNRLKIPFTLVFDNYQELPADSPLHEVMRDAGLELPQGARMIFISRDGPPPAFARLSARQAMDILSWPELRFTRREAAALVRRFASRRLQSGSIGAIYKSSDGWAAGLVLLLQQVRREGGTCFEAPLESSHVVFDYFANEIFKKLDPETKDVLLQTSFLPQLTASMAVQLTGMATAGEVLGKLYRRNYFIDRKTAAEPVFECHPLFREFLTVQAARTYNSTRRTEIRRTAAGVAEAGGSIETASDLLREANDWEGLTQLICAHAPNLLAQGRGETIESWVAAIPELMLRQKPRLLYWRGLCRLGWRHAESQSDLEQAFAAFRKQNDRSGMLLTASTLIQSLQGGGKVGPMDSWIEVLEELLHEGPAFPSEKVETTVAAAMLTAITFRRPRHPKGQYWAERALELTRHQPDLGLRTVIALNWFNYYFQLGELAKAALVVDDMRALMQSHDSAAVVVNAAMTVTFYEFLMGLSDYRNTVLKVLERSRSIGMFYTAKDIVLGAGLFGVLSDGDLKTAATWLQQLQKDEPFFGPGYHSWYEMFIVREALLRGDTNRAVSHQPEMLRQSLAAAWALNDAVAFLLSAQVLLASRRDKQAQAYLKRALKIAQDIRSPYIEFMARLVEAEFWSGNGRQARSLEALRTAMALGRVNNFVNSHIWNPKAMANLCAKALESGIEVEYVQNLVRKRKLVPEQPPVGVERWPWPLKVYTLGRFAVLKDDRHITFSHKVQRKPLDLLKAVIAKGSRGVREELLIDILWPETDGDAARRSLTSAIHRLRRLLGKEETVIRKDNKVSIDDRYCWVDVWAVDYLLGRAETMVRSNDGASTWTQATAVTRQAAELYHGAFLEADSDAPWSTPLADRIRTRLVRQLARVGQYFERRRQWQTAAHWYENGLAMDPCAEDICRRLMTTYHHLGRTGDLHVAYRHCRAALADRLGIAPSGETDLLLKRFSGNA